MRKLAVILTLVFILAAAPVASACEAGGVAENIRFASNREDREENENRFRLHFKSDEDKFQILGTVESVGDSSFVVGGQTILIDISKTPKFKQVGSIDVGDNLIVKGIVIDGVNYAQKIVVAGEKAGAEVLQFKIKGLSYAGTPTPTPAPSTSPSPSPEASPTASPSPSASPTASPSPEASPTVSPSPTASPTIVVDVKAKGPIEVVKEFLAQVLAYLEGLVS
jgi:hypothetical protein